MQRSSALLDCHIQNGLGQLHIDLSKVCPAWLHFQRGSSRLLGWSSHPECLAEGCMLQTILGLLLCLIKMPVLGFQSQQGPRHRAVHACQVPTEQGQCFGSANLQSCGHCLAPKAIAKPPAVSRAHLQGTHRN